MKLTSEQKNIIIELLKFKKDIQTLGGYAGTGKTTLISHIQQAIPNFAVCAFTGKAANVLRKKKMNASTIHSLIYKPEVDEMGHIVLDANGRPNFILTDDPGCEGFLVDEASMVGTDIYKDLCSFNKPIIWVGDHGQLEPIGEGMNLMSNPDFKLETIHRNAGEIAHFAEFIRKGFRPAAWEHQSGAGSKVKFVKKYDAEAWFTKVDQVICAFNKTRVQVNLKIRELLGHGKAWPIAGDRVMCLRNDKEKGLFNGMQGIVDRMFEKPRNKMEFVSDDATYEVLFDPTQFNREKYDFGHNRDDSAPFDYAYCITAHKSQGDEWQKVMVLEQQCKLWEHKRWAYTAASRAKDQVVWVEAY